MTPEYIMPEDTGKGEGPGMPEDPNNPEKSQGEPPEGGLPPIGDPSESQRAGVGSGDEPERPGEAGAGLTPEQAEELMEQLQKSRGGDADPRMQDPTRTEEGVVSESDSAANATEYEESEAMRKVEEEHAAFMAQIDELVAESDDQVFKNNIEVLKDPSKTVEELKNAGIASGLSFNTVEELLKAVGTDKKKIDEVSKHRHGFKSENENVVDEENQDLEQSFRDGIDEAKEVMSEIDQLGDKATKEDAERILGRVGQLKAKLFDPGTGLFREEDRMKRLVAKPFFTTLIVLLMSYMIILHTATKWATKRIGSG